MDRILKRIVFINIANSDYSSAEIAGNTCFVGTNNLGKTTLQRAILFFYNANTRGLGISSSQRSFEDYYFQYPNSYIIYEVATEEGCFHVMLYRNNKICYRFVDHAYDPDLYIENNEALLLKDVLYRLNQRKIYFSDQVETFERYRNIIYGADPDKKNRRFSLLRGNSMYHNIPLAIQAIFLSSESVIKAEFVKECIANSISSKHTTIELKTIERQLRQFSERYQDIETFFRKDNMQRGNLIKDNFNQIRNLKQKQRTLATELGAALKYAEVQKETLERDLQAMDEKIQALKASFSEEEQALKERMETLIGEKAIINKKLKDIDAKQKEYEKHNIQELIKLANDKHVLANELKARNAEYLTLTASFQDTEQQFRTLIDALENERKEFETAIKAQGLELDKRFQEERGFLKDEMQLEKEKLRDAHQEKIEHLRALVNEKNLELKEVEYQIKDIRKRSYFETEIKLLKRQLRELEERNKARRSELEICHNKLDGLKKEGEHIREKGEIAFNAFKKSNIDEIYATEDAIKEIEEKLSAYQDAFFGFLQEKYPDWMDTIGKVCHEELLYAKNLDPQLLKKDLDTLYGIKLNLADLKVQCRSLEQLELERSEHREWISEKQKEFLQFQEDHEKEQQALLAVLGKKVGMLKHQEEQLNYEAQQDEQKEKQLKLDLLEWEQKANAQKEQDTVALYEKEQVVQDEYGQLKTELDNLNKELELQTKTLSDAFNERLFVLKKDFDREAEELSVQKEEKLNAIREKKQGIERDKSDLLKEKGVDDSRIKKLKLEVEHIEKQLGLIEQHAQLVSEYIKDKRELFDHLERFQQEKASFEKKHEEEQTIFRSRKKAFERSLESLQEERRALAETHRKFKEGIDHFNRYFKEKALYERLRHIMDSVEAAPTATSLIDLCSQLLANDAEYHKQFQVFRNHVTDFVGRFRPDNHFNFKIGQNAGEHEYEKFAGQLQEFYFENRIQISIAEVAKSHGMLIDAIATKVKTLNDHKGKINRMVAKMETDFSKATFESSQLIEYIRLRSEDSENKVLRKLQKIAEFREQNPFMYGESNLFNADSKGKFEIDRRSVELLNDLLRTISEEHYDQIRVQDLFELRFRIKEGRNDTGWIEKIDKVGSTGTDMLVKAVIYITLLNVFIKESTERTAQSFKVHCIIDEVGQISAPYLKELISFAEQRNIYLINGLPNESKLETHYNYTYKFKKSANGYVRTVPLLAISLKV